MVVAASLIIQSTCMWRAEAKIGSGSSSKACFMAAQVENARRYDPMVGKCFESLPISEGGRVCVRIPFGDMVRSVFS